MDKKRNSTIKMRLTCAIIFITFTYLYLSCYQQEVLAAAQHKLSDGLTTYNYVLFPILTTLTLFLLEVGVFALTRVKKTFHALNYFPSLLFLAVITDIPCKMDESLSLGAWSWIVPLLLLLLGFAMWMIRQLEPYEPDNQSGLWMSRCTWQNIFQMLVMIVFVILIGNGNEVFHERMKMERLMSEGKYKEALEVGKMSSKTDSSLTMLRVACLHRTKMMGDRLFSYPLVGGSKAMIPDSVTTKSLMWTTPVWMHPMKNGKLRYIKPLDYQLCGLLLDKKLDQFVAAVNTAYRLDSVSLPKHYKEALMLYTHRRAHPKIVYHNAVMEADFQDFQTLERKYSNAMERNAALRDVYGNTYWYYYLYGNK